MTDDTLLGAGEKTSEGHGCEMCANDAVIACRLARQDWPAIGVRCAAYVPDYWAREAENDEAQR